MSNLRTVSIPTQNSGYDMWTRPMSISLPAEPFDIPPAQADETAPPARMIKSNRDWREDKELGLALWRAGK